MKLEYWIIIVPLKNIQFQSFEVDNEYFRVFLSINIDERRLCYGHFTAEENSEEYERHENIMANKG